MGVLGVLLANKTKQYLVLDVDPEAAVAALAAAAEPGDLVYGVWGDVDDELGDIALELGDGGYEVLRGIPGDGDVIVSGYASTIDNRAVAVNKKSLRELLREIFREGSDIIEFEAAVEEVK